MKRIYALTPVITVVFILIAMPGMTEVRLMNVNSLLKYYGFKNAEFTPGAKENRVVLASIATFGKIEKNASIDTPEEFITAAYYSPIQISKSAQSKIEKELPHSKDGALSLASMWMKKAAIYPENASSYRKVIELIKQKSNVSDAEISQFYSAAVEKEVMRLGKKHLGKFYSDAELKNTVLKPIVDYMVNPSPKGLTNIRNFQKSLADNEKVFFAYGKVIDELDSVLGPRVYLADN